MSQGMVDIVLTAGWAGLSAFAMAIIFSGPMRSAFLCFAVGAAGRLTRDLLLEAHVSLELASFLAAAVVASITLVALRRRGTPAVVIVSALLPLAASIACLRAIVGFVRLARASADEVNATSAAFLADVSTVFVTSLALVSGVSLVLFVAKIAAGLKAAY